MSRLLFLGVLIFIGLGDFAKASLVFMRETADGKHLYRLAEEGTLQLLTQGNNWHLYPEISSDEQLLAYATGEGPTSLQLALKNLVTGEVQTLTTEPGQYLHPSFSGSARFLAYASRPNSSSHSTIIIRDLTLQNGEELPCQNQCYFPSLSSDGELIAYQQTLSAQEKVITIYNRAEQKAITIPDHSYAMAPSFSKDDRYLVFTSKIDKNWDLYLYDRLTLQSSRLTLAAEEDYAPTFDANGDIIFASNRKKHFHLYRLPYSVWSAGLPHLNEASLEQITFGEQDDYAPSTSGENGFTHKLAIKIPGNPRSSFAALTHQNILYIAGGHQGKEHTYPPESFSNELYAYDFTNQTWSRLADRPSKAHGFQMAAYKNYLYAFGGFSYEASLNPRWKSLDVIERYNIAENKWERIGSMPRKRSSNVAVTIGTKVYLIGGWDSTPRFNGDLDGTFHSAIDVFDLESETITTANYNIPAPLRRAFSAVPYQGKIILVGGLGVGSSHFELLDRVTEIDPITGDFKELEKLPFATFAPAAGIVNNRLMVFGGMFKLSKYEYVYVNHIYQKNLLNLTSKWLHTGHYLEESKGFSQVAVVDKNSLAVLGGHSYQQNSDAPVSTFEIWGLTKSASPKY